MKGYIVQFVDQVLQWEFVCHALNINLRRPDLARTTRSKPLIMLFFSSSCLICGEFVITKNSPSSAIDIEVANHFLMFAKHRVD